MKWRMTAEKPSVQCAAGEEVGSRRRLIACWMRLRKGEGEDEHEDEDEGKIQIS